MLVADILEATVAVTGQSRTVLLGVSRAIEQARPRQVGMYLSHRMVKTTKSRIGKVWGGRDHTTVDHAIAVIERKLDQGDEEVIALVAAISLKAAEIQQVPEAAPIAKARALLIDRIETTSLALRRMQAALAGLDALLQPGAVQ